MRKILNSFFAVMLLALSATFVSCGGDDNDESADLIPTYQKTKCDFKVALSQAWSYIADVNVEVTDFNGAKQTLDPYSPNQQLIFEDATDLFPKEVKIKITSTPKENINFEVIDGKRFSDNISLSAVILNTQGEFMDNDGFNHNFSFTFKNDPNENEQDKIAYFNMLTTTMSKNITYKFTKENGKYSVTEIVE